MDIEKVIKDQDGTEYYAKDYRVGAEVTYEEQGTFGGYRNTFRVICGPNGEKFWHLVNQEKLYDSR